MHNSSQLQAPPLYRLINTQIKGEWMLTGSQRSTRSCAAMSQKHREPHQDKTDISAPELIQHMLVLEDGLSRPDTNQSGRLWRRVLVAVLCGALVVTILSDLTSGKGRPPSRNYLGWKQQHYSVGLNGRGRPEP